LPAVAGILEVEGMLSDAETVSPDEARRMVAEGAALIDLRSPDRYGAGHAPGAVNLPLDGVLAGADLPEGPVIFCCESGRDVWLNAERLRARVGALNFYAVARGLDEWRAEGLALVRR
jgi:rhodanese-related sulfurtransferase